LQETTVADSTQQFEFPDLVEEESLGIDIGVHADSNMSTDTTKVKQLNGFFVDTNPITDVDFTKNEVIIPKNKCGTKGSKEYSSAYTLATAALSPTLGATKHFVTKNEDGETDPGNGNYQNIEEQFVGNYAKIEDAQKHFISYDFMEIVLVRKWKTHLPVISGTSMVKRQSTYLRIGLTSPSERLRSGTLTSTVKEVMRITGLVLGCLPTFVICALKN
jgi:hypothetical protein